MNQKKLKQKNRELKARVFALEEFISLLRDLRDTTHTKSGTDEGEQRNIWRAVNETVTQTPQQNLTDLIIWALQTHLERFCTAYAQWQQAHPELSFTDWWQTEAQTMIQEITDEAG